MLESGVHATLAGVALGLLTPAWPLRSPRTFSADVRRSLNRFEDPYYERALTGAEFAETEQHIAEIGRLVLYATSPLERLERALTPWTAYVIVPLFALANAGVALDGEAVRGLASDRVTLGVVAGLVIGKTVGVFGASVAGVRLGIGRLLTPGWARSAQPAGRAERSSSPTSARLARRSRPVRRA